MTKIFPNPCFDCDMKHFNCKNYCERREEFIQEVMTAVNEMLGKKKKNVAEKSLSNLKYHRGDKNL